MLGQEMQMQPQEAPYLNAWEVWELYDTFLISPWVTDGRNDWAATYADVGKKAEIPFFNVRNKSSAGLEYNNQDSKENLSFAFHCYSVGVEFLAPAATSPSTNAKTYQLENHLFVAELVKHAALTIKLEQDTKLENAVMHCPAGAGISGYFMASPTGAGMETPDLGWANTASNGVADLKNRFKFPEPMRMPRNSVLQMRITFSQYARDMLQQMRGPGTYKFSMPQQAAVYWPAMSMIRVSVIGKREVQQRNQLHFGGPR